MKKLKNPLEPCSYSANYALRLVAKRLDGFPLDKARRMFVRDHSLYTSYGMRFFKDPIEHVGWWRRVLATMNPSGKVNWLLADPVQVFAFWPGGEKVVCDYYYKTTELFGENPEVAAFFDHRQIPGPVSEFFPATDLKKDTKLEPTDYKKMSMEERMEVLERSISMPAVGELTVEDTMRFIEACRDPDEFD